MRISLFTPVRQDAETLALVLESHRALSGVDQRIYIDDNTEWASSELLGREAENDERVRVCRPPAAEAAEYKGHKWTKAALNRIMEIRNHGIKVFLQTDCDAMFTVDSDTVVNPHTVSHLASLEKDIVGEVHWSKWPGCELWLPNTWQYHSFGFESNEEIVKLSQRGQMRVAGNGACNLIHRRVFEAGVDYSPIHALTRLLWGEDRWFSLRAECCGFELWADSDYPPFHVYTPDLLGEARKWWAEGAHPGYFRKYWLTSEWADKLREYKAF
jgi:hypothetical protein